MRVAPRQVLSLLRLPCSVTAGLILAGRLERPTFRTSRGRSAVELRRDWHRDMDSNHDYLGQNQAAYR